MSLVGIKDFELKSGEPITNSLVSKLVVNQETLSLLNDWNVYTGSGTFVIPTSVNHIELILIGGGGAGASGGPGGGGSSGVVTHDFVDVSGGETITYSCGSGGVGAVGAPGGGGGATSASGTFGSLTANGGTGGSSSTGGINKTGFNIPGGDSYTDASNNIGLYGQELGGLGVVGGGGGGCRLPFFVDLGPILITYLGTGGAGGSGGAGSNGGYAAGGGGSDGTGFKGGDGGAGVIFYRRIN